MESIRCVLKNTKRRMAVNGDAWFYDFCFQAIPKNNIETPTEREATYQFKVELEVTDSLMAYGKWPHTLEEVRQLQFLQYVKEELQKRQQPDKGEIIRLRLGTFTDNPQGTRGRFESGPVYSTEYINLTEPFWIEAKKRIGF